MSVSLKELCLLHLRDPAPQPFQPLMTLLDEDSPITWSTLQRVLHIDNLDVRPLEKLRQEQRLTAEQFEFGGEAVEFLKKQRQVPARQPNGLYESIYEVIWLHGFDQDYVVQTRSLYRGQFDSRWRQVSKLFRDRPDGRPLDVGTLVDRVRETEQFVGALKARQADFFAVTPTDDELLAVAQHYGFWTPMLDYTASLRVAAFFATWGSDKLTEPHSVIGAIHRLKWVVEDGKRIADNPGIADFGLLEGASIRVGHARFVKPRLAAEDNRIERQHGLFVTGFQPRDLQGVSLGSFFFWQEPGEVFQDPAENVTSSYLLPDTSPLALLAKQVSATCECGRLVALTTGLAATVLPQLGIFGSTGFALQAALTDGRLFFGTLEAHISRLKDADYVRHTLGQVFDEYYRLCHIRADLGNIPSNRQSSLDPFGLALSHLARLSGLEESQLQAAVRDNVPASLRDFRAWPETVIQPVPASDAERIALACGVYLASWELLQHVHGDAARDIATEAAGILGPVDDYLGLRR